jgi:hypothetical protein
MSKLTGILPDEIAAEKVVKQLSSLNIDRLDWTLQTPDQDTDRIIPAVAWPAGGVSGGVSATPLGLPIVADYPEDEVLADRGMEREDAEVVGRAVEHGGTLIIINVSDDYDDEIRAILESADASMITTD